MTKPKTYRVKDFFKICFLDNINVEVEYIVMPHALYGSFVILN
jgi:hypothetical protein